MQRLLPDEVVNSFFFRTIQLGVKSLLLHKMRTGLAGLGIFIGTTTVIWLVAVGEGVSFQAQEQIKELGANNVIVRTKEPTTTNAPQNAKVLVKRYGLLRADFRRIVETIPGISRAVPMREFRYELRRADRTADSKQRKPECLSGLRREGLKASFTMSSLRRAAAATGVCG